MTECVHNALKLDEELHSIGKSMPDNWVNRSKGMLCRTCMYFVAKNSKTKNSQVGRCRRRAPTMSGWPVMFFNDWCGDHKLNEEAPL